MRLSAAYAKQCKMSGLKREANGKWNENALKMKENRNNK